MDSSQPADANSGQSPENTVVPAEQALRASDSDRERAAAVLQEATADGRVSHAELEKRLDLVYRAKSRAELESLVKDLQPIQWADGSPTATKDSGIISSLVRKGRWVVGSEYRATAVIGSGVVDLREAQFTGPETTIRISAWLSTIYVVVPENVEVRVSGSGVIGGFEQDRESTGHGATHRVTVTGVAVCSTVRVVHRLPANQERRLSK
ncbi:DUF1707 domain-containing protein [Actinomadura opuntiae]|uniref:DUF1707 domain-containing protein n=1 Tax=Actinomadura sp. OS1-43 TaxID=604315 RepID=UPI00255ABF54|nr:DUF1707 domain-containing protein [Actinomadura sp. OS1-43]MDL4818703.1 DUF1707 domain-containing protein [Actinomadura sp. OS1-43]